MYWLTSHILGGLDDDGDLQQCDKLTAYDAYIKTWFDHLPPNDNIFTPNIISAQLVNNLYLVTDSLQRIVKTSY